MLDMKRDMEILAPVGNREMLEVAIANGADAVYFGLENFNARAKAESFDSHNIRSVIDRCHLFGVKVYVTVNTLVSDSEFDDVVAMVERAHAAKADAFIVQDLGLMFYLKKAFPNIVIHASTQAGICNEYGARVLKKIGVTRVVVSRETTLEDIKRIKAAGLEVEVFVQGALCVCFSGSCYVSSLLKNKSGNRGECLQLCRLPYKLVQNGKIQKQGYLLSTRDLSLLSRIDELRGAGVDSLKIEGRLRRPAYLAQAIKSVKNAISNEPDLKEQDFALKKVFSRGDFNKGIYLKTKTDGGIMNSDVNNHLGVKIGKVQDVRAFKDIFEIKISSSHKICKNDGIKFISAGKEQSLGVGSVKELGNDLYVVHTKAKPQVGADVYLTVDSQSENLLLQKVRKLKVLANVNVVAGKPIELELECNGITVQVRGAIAEAAKTQPLSEKQISENICKLGDTNFEVQTINVNTKNAFVAKSALNELRRNAISALEKKLIENHEIQNCKKFVRTDKLSLKKANFKTDFNFYVVNNINQIKSINDSKAKIVFAPEIYTKQNVECIKQHVQAHFSAKLYLYLPVVANFKDLEILNEIINNYGKNEIGLMAGSVYGLHYAEHGFDVVCGLNMNVSNSMVLAALGELGAINATSSIETNIFGAVDGAHKYAGSPAVMTLVMCPFIEHCGSKCERCNFKQNTELVMDNNANFSLRRQKIADCYFDLILKKEKPRIQGNGYVVDLRD